MATIGDRIRFLRESANLTQEDFGKLFGIVKSTVSLYEHGKSTPNDQIKTAICKHFDVSMDFLLGLSNAEQPGPSNKKKPLTTGQGDKIIQKALAGSGLLSADGSLPPESEELISDFLAQNATILKKLLKDGK